MRGISEERLRVELHTHTCASEDSMMKPEQLLRQCEQLGIDRIAITDHNTIAMALKMKELAPERVIVGEEIETTQGELIAYYLKEEVPSGLEPLETIRRLRNQGAVISIPHPFDTIRNPSWTPAQLEVIAPYVDAVEAFNARCLNNAANLQAKAFAQAHHLLETVGSDAHSLMEIGKANLLMDSFDDGESFRTALVSANQLTAKSSFVVHLVSRFAVYYKKLMGKK
jgi:predicted metal-dependent phosphoesterase TrpH